MKIRLGITAGIGIGLTVLLLVLMGITSEANASELATPFPPQPLEGEFTMWFLAGDTAPVYFPLEETAWGGGEVACQVLVGGGVGDTTLSLSLGITTVATATAPFASPVWVQTNESVGSVFWSWGAGAYYQDHLLTCSWTFTSTQPPPPEPALLEVQLDGSVITLTLHLFMDWSFPNDFDQGIVYYISDNVTNTWSNIWEPVEICPISDPQWEWSQEISDTIDTIWISTTTPMSWIVSGGGWLPTLDGRGIERPVILPPNPKPPSIATWFSPSGLLGSGQVITINIWAVSENTTYTLNITDVLPSHVTPTGIITWTPTVTSPWGTWGASFPVTIEEGYTGQLTNVVNVTTNGFSRTYTATATVVEPIDLEILTWPDEPFETELLGRYTQWFTVTTETTATNVLVRVQIPHVTGFWRSQWWQSECWDTTFDGYWHNCRWDVITPGLPILMHFNYWNLGLPGTRSVKANVSAEQPDTHLINNSVYVTFTVQPECREVTGVELTVINTDTIVTATAVEFSADISPEDTAKPYSYTMDFGDGITGTDSSDLDPLVDAPNMGHYYTAPGVYTVTISIQNCGVQVTDVVTVEVVDLPKIRVFLPLVLKGH